MSRARRRPSPPPPRPLLRRPPDARAEATAAGGGLGVALAAGALAWYLARVLLARERLADGAAGARVADVRGAGTT